MKKLIAITASIGFALTHVQAFTVFDPTVNATIKLQTAQEIAKFVQMINNQVQQIQTLKNQLDEFKHYESLFGDPKAVVLTTVQPLVTDLRKTELGQTLTALEGAVDAGEAMLYSANGLFSSIGTTFTTPNGATVTRREAPYLPIAAVQKTTDNFLSVSADATARRIALKEEIARTTTGDRPTHCVEGGNRPHNDGTQERHHRRRSAKADRRAHWPVIRAQQHGLRNQPGDRVRARAGRCQSE